MKNFLEKLSKYWQLRLVAMGAGVLLIAYAVLLPDSGDESSNRSIESVVAAPLTQPAATGNTPSSPSTNALSKSDGSLGDSRKPDLHSSEQPGLKSGASWQVTDHAVADELEIPVRNTEDADLSRDFSESIRRLQIAANRGDPVAEILLGHAYESGAGVRKDLNETTRWYARAVDGQTSGKAGYDDVSPRVSQPEIDLSRAFASYRTAAERGDASAQLYLGLAYDLGRDVPRNTDQAIHWYRLAQAGGSASAASNLGVLYHNGDSMAKDPVEAARWFQVAASQGCASAQYSLGRAYLQGDGVQKDSAEAAKWLQKSAQQGNASAQILLSYLYATGQGVSSSTPLAYMWINLASAHDNLARVARMRLEKVAYANEIIEGQRLTHDWLKHHPQPT